MSNPNLHVKHKKYTIKFKEEFVRYVKEEMNQDVNDFVDCDEDLNIIVEKD